MKYLRVSFWLMCATLIALPIFGQDEKRKRQGGRQRSASALMEQHDKNKDGVLEKSEVPQQIQRRFDQMDSNGDGKVTAEELEKYLGRGQGGGRPSQGAGRAGAGSKSAGGEINTPPARGERHEEKIKVGDMAPDFTLSDPDGKKKVTLSDFRGKKPVVLIFGSFT